MHWSLIGLLIRRLAILRLWLLILGWLLIGLLRSLIRWLLRHLWVVKVFFHSEKYLNVGNCCLIFQNYIIFTAKTSKKARNCTKTPHFENDCRIIMKFYRFYALEYVINFLSLHY